MIKGWFTQHKETGNWHQIEDVKDTGIPAHKPGGGNVVKLKGHDEWVHASKLSGMEPKAPMKKADQLKGGLGDKKKPSDFDSKMLEIGIQVELEHTDDKLLAREIAMDHLTEDPQYYTKLKDIEKYDRVEEEVDGKKEFDYGHEDLEKRWNSLRKAVLDHESSIMSIEDQEYHDDEDEEEGDSESDSEADVQEGQSVPETSVSQGEDSEESMEDESAETSIPESEIIQILRDEGHSDAEIAHILHGHIMPEATIDDVKMDAEQQMSDHKMNAEQQMSDHKMQHQKRMDDLNYELAASEQETNGLDKDHKKRMLNLEYEYAKKEKELELKHKEKELNLKLAHQKEKSAQKVEEVKSKNAERSRSMDAAKTSKKEREGKD